MRYLHLSPSAIEEGIRALEQPAPSFGRGEIGETETAEKGKTK